MSMLPDWLIEKSISIEPMEIGKYCGTRISSGLSSYGYDVRLGFNFKRFIGLEFDPKVPRPEDWISWESQGPVVIQPHDIVLSESIEEFKLPKNVIGIIENKSTYTRSGLGLYTAPIEPEWQGKLTLTLVNSTNRNIVVYPGEGIAQIVFFQSPHNCLKTYADKKGKYQGETTITLSK